MTASVALIGVGNPWRGDDGVSWAVVESAGRRLGPDVAVFQADGEAARLLDAWSDVDVAVVVDAMHSGAPAGTVRVWSDPSELSRSSLPTSSHAVGLAHAVALGRVLNRLPRRMVVVGVEVGDVTLGAGLSVAAAGSISAAVDAVVDQVQAGS